MGNAWDATIKGEYEPPPPDHAGQRKPHWIPLVITQREIRELLAAPHMNPLELLALRTLYASGIEARELVLLKREHLQTDTASLKFDKRVALLDDETFQRLASLNWADWRWTARKLDGVLERAAKGLVGRRYAAMERKLRPQALRIAFAAHSLENGMGLFSLHNLLGFPELDDTENVIEIAVGLWLSVYDKAHPLARDHTATTRAGKKLKPADLSVDETMTMLQATSVGATGEPDRLMLRTIYAAGLRVSELTGLLVADIEADERRLFLRKAKEAKDRYTLVDSETARQLGEWIAGKSPDQLAFPWSTKYIRTFITDAAKATGLDEKFSGIRSISPHTFRHGHATHLYAGGMEPGVIKKLLGHASVEQTMDYIACGPAEWREAYDRSRRLD